MSFHPESLCSLFTSAVSLSSGLLCLSRPSLSRAIKLLHPGDQLGDNQGFRRYIKALVITLSIVWLLLHLRAVFNLT